MHQRVGITLLLRYLGCALATQSDASTLTHALILGDALPCCLGIRVVH